MRQWRRSVAMGASVVALAMTLACGRDDGTAPAIDSPAGRWTGVTNGITLTLVLRDLSGEIGGSGTLVSGSSTTAFSVLSGSWSEGSTTRSLALTFASQSPTAPLRYTCTTKSADSCDGPVVFPDGNTVFFKIER